MTSDFIDYYAENISKTSVINQGVVEYLEWCKEKKFILPFARTKWNI